MPSSSAFSTGPPPADVRSRAVPKPVCSERVPRPKPYRHRCAYFIAGTRFWRGIWVLVLLGVLGGLPAAAQDADVQLWYGPRQFFGQNGEPQRWVNVLGTVVDTARVEVLTYRLNGGPADTLSMGSDLHRLAEPGDFNVELAWDEMEPGENDLVVTARYADGRRATARTTLVVARGNTWPLPYRVDFAEVDSLQAVVQVVDGQWTLTDDGVRTAVPYYDRVLCLGDSTWQDYEALVRLTIHDFTPSEPGPPTYDVTHFGVAMRWRGHHADEHQPNRRWYPMGSQGELLLQRLPDSSRYRILFGSDHPTVVGEKTFPVRLGRQRWVRTQARTLADSSTLYRYKTWAAGEPEPLAWHAEGTEPQHLDYPSGSLCLVPHNSDVTIHEVAAAPLQRWSMEPAVRPGPGALHKSAPVGGVMGASGEPFSMEVLPLGARLRRLRVNLGSGPSYLVGGIEFETETSGGDLITHRIGAGTGAWQDWFTVPLGASLTGISGASGWFIDALQFHFDDGSASPRYGGAGGDTTFRLQLQASAEGTSGRLRGFYGTAADGLIETLGLVFDPAH